MSFVLFSSSALPKYELTHIQQGPRCQLVNLTLAGIIHLSKMCSKVHVAFLSNLRSPFHHGRKNNVSKVMWPALFDPLHCGNGHWLPLTFLHMSTTQNWAQTSKCQWTNEIQKVSTSNHPSPFFSPSCSSLYYLELMWDAGVSVWYVTFATMWLLSCSSQAGLCPFPISNLFYRTERKYCFQEN